TKPPQLFCGVVYVVGSVDVAWCGIGGGDVGDVGGDDGDVKMRMMTMLVPWIWWWWRRRLLAAAWRWQPQWRWCGWIGGEDDDVMVVLIVVVRVAGAWHDGVAGNPPERRRILKRMGDVWLGFVKNMVT
ncbi:hypothetical protein Tco_0369849, partial [Tanacetum coccineum]